MAHAIRLSVFSGDSPALGQVSRMNCDASSSSVSAYASWPAGKPGHLSFRSSTVANGGSTAATAHPLLLASRFESVDAGYQIVPLCFSGESIIPFIALVTLSAVCAVSTSGTLRPLRTLRPLWTLRTTGTYIDGVTVLIKKRRRLEILTSYRLRTCNQPHLLSRLRHPHPPLMPRPLMFHSLKDRVSRPASTHQPNGRETLRKRPIRH